MGYDCGLFRSNLLALRCFVAVCVPYLFPKIQWVGLLSGIVALSGHTHLFLCEYGVFESVPLSHEIKVYHQNKDKFEEQQYQFNH